MVMIRFRLAVGNRPIGIYDSRATPEHLSDMLGKSSDRESVDLLSGIF
jgi:hypothetical protein